MGRGEAKEAGNVARAWMSGVAAALGALAGCSDGNGGSEPPPSVTDAGYDVAFDEAVALFDEATAAGLTPLDALPTSGSATYDGVMYLDTGFVEPGPDGDNELLGDLRIGIDFGNPRDAVTGRVTDFVDEDDQRYAGTLTLSNGDLAPREDPVLIADMDGTLTAPDGTDYAIEADLGADFFGEDHEFVVGGVGGEACGGGSCTDLEGGFTAER